MEDDPLSWGAEQVGAPDASAAPSLSFTARATGYFPVPPTDPRYQMEGGYVGAAEWHGQKLPQQEPLYTLDQYRRGEAPYVSVAMDNSPSNPLAYGSTIHSPDLPGIPFRVMDTGSAFNGRTRKYGGPKGLGRVDIARDDNRGATHAEVNRPLRFVAGAPPQETPNQSAATAPFEGNPGPAIGDHAASNFGGFDPSGWGAVPLEEKTQSPEQWGAVPSVGGFGDLRMAARPLLERAQTATPEQQAQGEQGIKEGLNYLDFLNFSQTAGDAAQAQQERRRVDLARSSPPASEFGFSTGSEPMALPSAEEFNAPLLQSPYLHDVMDYGVGGAIGNRVLGTAEGFSSPQNLAIMTALPFLPPPAQKAVGAGFAGLMGKDAVQEAIAGSQTTGDEATGHYTQAVIDALMSGAAGKHAFGRPPAGGAPRPLYVPPEAPKAPTAPAASAGATVLPTTEVPTETRATSPSEEVKPTGPPVPNENPPIPEAAPVTPDLRAGAKAGIDALRQGADKTGEPLDASTKTPDTSRTKQGAEGVATGQKPADAGQIAPGVGQPENVTSIKNAQTDIDRAAMALRPAGEPVRRPQPQVEAEARAAAPGATDRLVAELAEAPREVSDTESAQLAIKWSEEKAGMAAANDAVIAAREVGDEAAVSRAMTDRTAREERLQSLADTLHAVGTKAGQSLNARKMFNASDWSEEGIIKNTRAKLGGRKLTTGPGGEMEAAIALAKTVAEKQAELDAAGAKATAATAAATHTETRDDLVQEVAREDAASTKQPPDKSPAAKAFLEKLHSMRDEARARLKKGGTTFSSGGLGDVGKLKDYAIIMASHIADGVVKGSELASKMKAEFGEWIGQHLPEIYKQAKEIGAALRKAGTVVSPDEMAKRMKARLDEGLHSLADTIPYVREIAKGHIRAGIKEVEPLQAAVHETLKGAIPGIDRTTSNDLFSQIGQFTRLSKDPVDVIYRDLKAQGLSLSKLEKMAKGEAPPMTGGERPPKTDKQRALERLVAEEKKKGGYTVTDPETQLRSAAQAMETRLANQYKDLVTEFDTGVAPGGNRAPVTSARGEVLKGLIARVKESLDGVREAKKLSEEGRADAALKRLTKAHEDLLRRMEADDFNVRRGGPGITRPDVLAARARLAAARAENLELRAIEREISGAAEAKRIEDLQKSIVAIDERLKTGKIEVEAAKPGAPMSNAREALVAERAAMQRQVNEMRAAARRKTPDEIERKKLEKAIEALKALDDKLQAGDLSTATKTPAPMGAAREAVMSEKAAMQAQLAQMRRDAKPRLSESERTLIARKAQVARQTADLRDRVARDYAGPKKRVQKPLTPDPALRQAEAGLAALKNDYLRGVENKRIANMPAWERALDFYAGPWARNINALSGVPVLAKLTSIALQTAGFIRPVERLFQYGASKVFSRAANRAPIEGVMSLKEYGAAELAAVKGTFRNLWRDFTGAADTSGRARALKLGTTDFDLAYGKEKIHPDHWSDFTGAVHKALKTSVRRNEFERAMVSQMAHARRHGMTEAEIADPLTQAGFGARAYERAMRSVFQESNAGVQGYKAFLRILQNSGAGGKVAAGLIRGELPVVNIPTNFAKAVIGEYIGGLYTLPELAVRYAKGIDSMKPEQADRIFRTMARGTMGAGLMVAGFYLRDHIGGYFHGQHAHHRGPDYNEAEIGGKRVPRAVQHTLAAETMQFGATIGHVFDERMAKEGAVNAGAEGAFAAVLGLSEEVPFYGQAVRTVRQSEKGFGDFAGQWLAGKAEPQLVQYAARLGDMRKGENTPLDYLQPKAKQRKPAGSAFHKIGDYLKTGLPYLREQVPQKR